MSYLKDQLWLTEALQYRLDIINPRFPWLFPSPPQGIKSTILEYLIVNGEMHRHCSTIQNNGLKINDCGEEGQIVPRYDNTT